jgi:hypothetical protein
MGAGAGRAAAAVAGCGLAGIAIALVLLLSARTPVAIDDNGHVSSATVVNLLPAQSVCQAERSVPRGTAALGLDAVPYDDARRGPLVATITRLSLAVASGRLERVRPGANHLVLDAPLAASGPATICVQNASAATVGVNGDPHVAPPPQASGVRLLGALGLRFEKSARESIWAQLPAIARRFSYAKAPFLGRWTMWALLGVLAAIWVGALWTLRTALRAAT